MGQIPTAKEFLFKNADRFQSTPDEWMIEFTKLHIEAALKAASENAESYVIGGLTSEVDKESILTAYPLENIN
jgi:hypothetical protein